MLLLLIFYQALPVPFLVTKDFSEYLCKFVRLHKSIRFVIPLIPRIGNVKGSSVTMRGPVAGIWVAAALEPSDIFFCTEHRTYNKLVIKQILALQRISKCLGDTVQAALCTFCKIWDRVFEIVNRIISVVFDSYKANSPDVIAGFRYGFKSKPAAASRCASLRSANHLA